MPATETVREGVGEKAKVGESFVKAVAVREVAFDDLEQIGCLVRSVSNGFKMLQDDKLSVSSAACVQMIDRRFWVVCISHAVECGVQT